MRLKSIGTRIFIYIIPIITLTTVLFVSLSYISSEKKTEAALDEKMMQNLNAANLELEMELQKNSFVAESTAVYAETIAEARINGFLNETEANRFISLTLTSNPNTIGAGIWFSGNDSYYAYINESGKAEVITNYSDYMDFMTKEWYIDAKNANGKIVWSIIYFDPVTQENVITASKAFYNSNGDFYGVASANMALSNIGNAINEIAIDKSGKAFIISKVGRYITFYDDTRGIEDIITKETDSEWSALGEILLYNNSGMTSFINNGKKEFVYFTTMDDITWTLAIVYDAEELSMNKISEFLSATIIPVIGLILVIYGVYLVIRYLHKIINKVNSFSYLAADGNFTKFIDITETDEFGVMEQNLNKMVSNMNEMHNKSIILLEQAKAANEAKSGFLSRMSHEIRTPMTAIIGMTQIAKSTEDIEKIKSCLGKIDNASKHLFNLINDILDMSKIEANKLELNNDSFNLINCINSVYNVINVKTEEKGQKLIIDIKQNVPEHIIGDELRLTQVFTNLIGNAMKFTPDNGVIKVTVRETKKDGNISVIETSVSDNGIGLSKEQQSKLFNAFEQADGSISRKYGGTGLGLVICKRIVEMMGGNIWVESEENKGSTFSFNIKAKCSSDKAKKDIQYTQGISIRDLRILAVDDSEESLDYLRHLLNKFDIKCDISKNGLDAIDKVEMSIFERKPYDIVFMDYYMPGLNGIETAKKIREISNDSTSVIMVSILDWKDMEKNAKEAGIVHYITKPVSPSSLLDKLYKAVNSVAGITYKKTDILSRDLSESNILLVEDNEINREIVIAMLSDTGVNIDIAENGIAACNKFEAEPDKYDLIFMDIQMPEMDGFEATRKIRGMNIKKAKTIPIIAMTANAFKEDIDKCIEAGMVDHISKPLDPEILQIKINDYLFMKDFINKDIF